MDDDLWALIEPLLPAWPDKAPGRPRPVPDRLCLQGILYVLHNDIALQLLPPARSTLYERGWTDPDGQATETGARHRAELEQHTDELAGGPWQALGARGAARLAQLTAPLTKTVAASGILPRQSTLGLGRPTRGEAS